MKRLLLALSLLSFSYSCFAAKAIVTGTLIDTNTSTLYVDISVNFTPVGGYVTNNDGTVSIYKGPIISQVQRGRLYQLLSGGTYAFDLGEGSETNYFSVTNGGTYDIAQLLGKTSLSISSSITNSGNVTNYNLGSPDGASTNYVNTATNDLNTLVLTYTNGLAKLTDVQASTNSLVNLTTLQNATNDLNTLVKTYTNGLGSGSAPADYATTNYVNTATNILDTRVKAYTNSLAKSTEVAGATNDLNTLVKTYTNGLATSTQLAGATNDLNTTVKTYTNGLASVTQLNNATNDLRTFTLTLASGMFQFSTNVTILTNYIRGWWGPTNYLGTNYFIPLCTTN